MSAENICLSLRQAAKHKSNDVATRTLTFDGERVAAEMSWLELWREVELLSRLILSFGLRRGDCLGVLGHNSADYLQILYACADLGIIFVPLNVRWSASELRHAICDCSINVLAILDYHLLSFVAVLWTGWGAAAGVHISWLLMPSQAGRLSPATSGESARSSSWRVMAVANAANVTEWTNPADVDSEGTDAAHGASTSGVDFVMGFGGGGNGKDALDITDVSLGTGDGDKGITDADVFCIVHTSGSTGRSKGVALTHVGQAGLKQVARQVAQARAKCLHIGYSSSTTYLNVLPLFHVGGISTTLAITMVGGCHVFVPRFSASSGRAAVGTGRVNALALVPTMLHMLLHDARGGVVRVGLFEGVEKVVVGGQPMSRHLERTARTCMPKAMFVQTYACSEAGSTITFAFSPPSPSASPSACTDERQDGPKYSKFGTGGISAKHVEIRVVDHGSERGGTAVKLAAPNGVGEVETRGPHVMKGYWRRPDLTIGVLRPDGWLRTGDLGRLDERSGRLVIVGRAKDVIKSGGENVHATEVEAVLLRHCWVAEAAAYGVDDERLGEKIVASVVLDKPALENEEDVSGDRARAVLRSFCDLHLSHYKRPRRIDIVPALPKNGSGKLLRHRLRASL